MPLQMLAAFHYLGENRNFINFHQAKHRIMQYKLINCKITEEKIILLSSTKSPREKRSYWIKQSICRGLKFVYWRIKEIQVQKDCLHMSGNILKRKLQPMIKSMVNSDHSKGHRGSWNNRSIHINERFGFFIEKKKSTRQ